jgi:hypothetical protein
MELVPNFMSAAALRKHVTEYTWRIRIVKRLRAERGLVCEICGFRAENPGIMDSHEVYEYSEDGSVRLSNIQILCSRCHDIKDFAQTERLIAEGHKPQARRDLIIEHFCRVNSCTLAEFKKHLSEAMCAVQELEKRYGPVLPHDRIDYGPFQDEFMKCQARRQAVPPHRRGAAAMNWYSATEKAIRIAKEHGVHPDYHDEILELARQDDRFRADILNLVRDSQFDAAVELIVRLLDEVDDDGSEVLPDHELIYAPNGDLYGHHWPD